MKGFQKVTPMGLEVKGAAEIKKALRAMTAEMNHKVIGQANAAAGKIVVAREQALAPDGPTGNLIDSIGLIKTSIKKADELGEVQVGPRRKGRYKGFAGHLVEYGTKRRQNKNGANRGVMPKRPFAEPAFEQTRGEVEKKISEELGKRITAVLKKNVKS